MIINIPVKYNFMIRTFLLIFISLLSYTGHSQAPGKVIENERINSNILGKTMNYSVYLPYDYSSSDMAYPVVYLLHGFTDDNTAWLQFGQINRLADKAIQEGVIPPMIIIMPNADSTFYINSYDGKENYEDYFLKELIPVVEKKYRIKSDKAYRGITGLSMGGYGSLIYALKHPDLFAACAPLSAAVWDDGAIVNMDESGYNNTLGRVLGRNLKGNARLSKTWVQNAPFNIIKQKTTQQLSQVRYWIDCGDDDFLIKGNCLLHIALTEKGVPHEFRVRDGGHTWEYWRTGIIPALAFIGKSFTR